MFSFFFSAVPIVSNTVRAHALKTLFSKCSLHFQIVLNTVRMHALETLFSTKILCSYKSFQIVSECKQKMNAKIRVALGVCFSIVHSCWPHMICSLATQSRSSLAEIVGYVADFFCVNFVELWITYRSDVSYFYNHGTHSHLQNTCTFSPFIVLRVFSSVFSVYFVQCFLCI